MLIIKKENQVFFILLLKGIVLQYRGGLLVVLTDGL
jgi:hypothetical protein